MPETVEIVDVTLRDGLQDQPTIVPTEAKLEIADLLAGAGFPAIEVTSFVRRDWVPQLSDAAELLAAFHPGSRVVRHGLVPNRRGLERALQTDVEWVDFVVSASNQHNLHNINRTTEQSLAEIATMTAEAQSAGKLVRASVSTAFGCPFQGEVSEAEVLKVLGAYLAAGVQRVNLSDTIGVATPDSFTRILDASLSFAGGPEKLGIHLHDPGSGVGALVDIALDRGIRSFDAAIGGLGGCPFAPGAPGNAKAEELVPQLEARGFTTGIDSAMLPRIALTIGLALGRGAAAPARAEPVPATA
ncbi:MAG: hydroxymethylglutaryl-CoA lyase [Chloroflexota bacterium]